MATSRKQLKEIPCKYEIGDTFSDGNRNYTVLARRTRDDFHAILKEPMYMMERFPGEIIKNNKDNTMHWMPCHSEECGCRDYWTNVKQEINNLKSE